jgi:hypothetical protein
LLGAVAAAPAKVLLQAAVAMAAVANYRQHGLPLVVNSLLEHDGLSLVVVIVLLLLLNHNRLGVVMPVVLIGDDRDYLGLIVVPLVLPLLLVELPGSTGSLERANPVVARCHHGRESHNQHGDG